MSIPCMSGDSPMTLPLVQHQCGLIKRGIPSAAGRLSVSWCRTPVVLVPGDILGVVMRILRRYHGDAHIPRIPRGAKPPQIRALCPQQASLRAKGMLGPHGKVFQVTNRSQGQEGASPRPLLIKLLIRICFLRARMY
jgi:hypothetical protein